MVENDDITIETFLLSVTNAENAKAAHDTRAERVVSVNDCSLLSISSGSGTIVKTAPEHPEEDGTNLVRIDGLHLS